MLEAGFILIAAAIKVWIASRPLEAIAWAIYDDRWFLQKAQSILDGQWFGDYNYLTLIKGPIYPLWIALLSRCGLPLLPAEQILYAAACVVVTSSFSPALPSRVARAAFYLVLLINPISFADGIATRTLREFLNLSLVLLACGAVAGIGLRLDAPLARLVAWALFAGVALAALWHTREEAVWILPLPAVAAVIIVRWWRTAPRRRAAHAALVLAVPLSIVAAAHIGLRLMNDRHYGVFEIVEFQDESFLRAYGSLTHVRPHPPRPRVPVPKEVRERVYAVSPAFAELRPTLEGPIGSGWGETEHQGEMGGASFMWAFRQAVAHAGYYDRGSGAVREYYDRLTGEIAAARRSGRLDAREPRATLVPPLLEGQRRAVLARWLHGLLRIARFEDLSVAASHSIGPRSDWSDYAITRTRLAPELRFSEALRFRLALSAPDVGVTIEGGRPRVRELGPQRLEIEAPARGAFLVLSRGGTRVERIALSYAPPVSNSGLVSAENFEIVSTPVSQSSALDRNRLRILQGVAAIYRNAFAPCLVAAALLYCANLTRLVRRRGWTMPLLLGGILAALAARVMILAVIDVTSFWVFWIAYEAPAHALLLVAFMLMAHDGVTALKERLVPFPLRR